ncbi:uncharacterized protein LOC109621675 [Aedes albopictus]|uniref:Uncharacterized protein n=1 Tax=Aedes albopictus TaxID=7160 RepID=A0ABM1XW90_AEDAL|nr:uncharacterized protein LOC109621675 [Aedes albopictus]
MALISPPSDHLNEIPRSLLDRLLFVERIVLGRNSSVLAVITADRQLLEVKERSIVACVDLGGGSGVEDVGRSVHEPPVVSSIFGTLSPKESDESRDQRIVLTVFRSFDGSDRKLFYLLELDRKLLVVEREQSPCVKFVLRESFEGFIKLLITERDDRVGCPVIKIYVEQQLEPIVTDFHAHRVESSAASVNNFTCFHEILKSLKERVNQRRAELAALQTVTGELFERMNGQLKHVPSLLRTENPDERQPLVKYGDVWTKVHNDRLVIGVPVFNCTYKRCLTLTNLKLFVKSLTQQQPFEYSCKYYQLKDDDFNFKNLEQILEAEDIISDVPLFQQEWEQPKVNALHSGQTGILVATTKLSSLDTLQLATVFECFVSYDVATTGQDSCPRLQLFVGLVEVKRTDLYSTNLAAGFSGRDTFKDLLSVTATSQFLALEIAFQKVPIRGFDRFCLETLKFRSVNLGSAAVELHQQELPNILYYDDNGYWRSMLIRLDELKQTRQKIKIYCTNSHQILALLHAIYSDYEEKCSINLIEDQSTNVMDFKESLLNELTAKIENPSDVRSILLQELKTDSLYSKSTI